jgi:hypothetical protein
VYGFWWTQLQGDAAGWADEFGGVSGAADKWADQFAQQMVPNEEVAGWMSDWEAQAVRAHEALASTGTSAEYSMSEDNAFLGVILLFITPPSASSGRMRCQNADGHAAGGRSGVERGKGQFQADKPGVLWCRTLRALPRGRRCSRAGC